MHSGQNLKLSDSPSSPRGGRNRGGLDNLMLTHHPRSSQGKTTRGGLFPMFPPCGKKRNVDALRVPFRNEELQVRAGCAKSRANSYQVLAS
ncbi:hypothetical protein V6N12_071888 [Hibiscus sabdariffa]|uniref:Uncharacterized protein n=1 Tax=Hibiscus sabdariffa TaxID=183260 RepID=A0ABR2FL26_9ROSI